MSLLSVSDLAASTPLSPEAALSRAEALVTSAICPALPDLGIHTWAAQYRIRNEQRALGLPLYGRRRLGPEVLRYWPITGLSAVSQDGTDVLADCTFDTFSIRKDALSAEFLGLGVISVTFQTGWAVDDLPAPIREAILLTARETLAGTEGGVIMERLGDVQTQYAPGRPALTDAALRLVSPWRYAGPG